MSRFVPITCKVCAQSEMAIEMVEVNGQWLVDRRREKFFKGKSGHCHMCMLKLKPVRLEVDVKMLVGLMGRLERLIKMACLVNS